MDALDKDTLLFDDIFADKSAEMSEKNKFSCEYDSLFDEIFCRNQKCGRDKYNINRVSGAVPPQERTNRDRYPVMLIED